MPKKLAGCIIVTALLSACGREVPSNPVAMTPPPLPLIFPMSELTPVSLDTHIPGTSFDAGYARTCDGNIKSVSFTQSDITTSHGSGAVTKIVGDSLITYDITKGSLSGSKVPDTATVTLTGRLTPFVVIVNSRYSAPLTADSREKTIILPGETFAPDADGKIHGIKICFS